MQLLRCGCQLLGECRDFICFSLYRGNSRSDLLEHPVETLLEEAELIGLGGRGADGEEPLLRFSHDAARAADALDERRGNPFEHHRDDDEHARLEVGARIEPAVEPRRHQIGDRGHQHEEVADGLSLIERVR